MNMEFAIAFRALFPIASFVSQNIFHYAAVKGAFIRREQENQNLSGIQDSSKHANCTLELTDNLSKNGKSPEP